MVYERVKGWTSGRSLPAWNIFEYPQALWAWMIIEMTHIWKYFCLHLDHLNKRGDNTFDQNGSLFNSLAFFSYNVNDSTLLLKVCAKILFQEEIPYTVEPRYNDPWYYHVPGITMNILCPGKSYGKMYGTERRY